MSSAMLGFGLLFLFGLVNVLWPRGWWRIAEGWKYRNPEAVAPSDSAIGVQRVAGGFLCLAAILIPVWGAANEHQADEDERREQAAAEVKATNREVADRYRQRVVDEAGRLAISPRQLPVAVLEPQGVDHLSARRRPDFATTGDVAVYVSAGAGEDWCVIFPDKAGFPGSVDERPCGYERNLINRFAGEMMARYRTGRPPDLATAKQVATLTSPPLVVLEGRDPRQFTVRLDPVYGGGWCVTFPDSPPGNPTINEGDCPYRLSSR